VAGLFYLKTIITFVTEIGINEVFKNRVMKDKCIELVVKVLRSTIVWIRTKCLFLKIAFNLFVMRSCFSRTNLIERINGTTN